MLMAPRKRYTVQHTRIRRGEWSTTVEQGSSLESWSKTFTTRTRWGGARRAASVAWYQEQSEAKSFDPNGPYTIGGTTW